MLLIYGASSLRCLFTVDSFLDLARDSLFDDDISELVLALFVQLGFGRGHIDIALAHIVHSLATLFSFTTPLGLLLCTTRIQMLVTLQEKVLDPEHGGVENHGQDDHDSDQF